MYSRERRQRSLIGIQSRIAQNGVNQRTKSRASGAARNFLDRFDADINLEIFGRVGRFTSSEDVELFDLRTNSDQLTMLHPSLVGDHARRLHFRPIASKDLFLPKAQIRRRV